MVGGGRGQQQGRIKGGVVRAAKGVSKQSASANNVTVPPRRQICLVSFFFFAFFFFNMYSINLETWTRFQAQGAWVPPEREATELTVLCPSLCGWRRGVGPPGVSFWCVGGERRGGLCFFCKQKENPLSRRNS